MKEKVLKYIIELVFIFIIPLALLATCFKQEKVYDENNNEVGKYLTFDNIFVLSDETISYFNYEYYEHDEQIPILAYDHFYYNANISSTIRYISGNDYIYFEYEGDTFQYTIGTGLTNIITGVILTNNDYGIKCVRNSNTNNTLINHYDNIIKNINSYTISDNVISRLLNSLYDTLGITNNWILQFILVYTLLWIIMWFIWHILYLPLDFICSKLLFDRVDK